MGEVVTCTPFLWVVLARKLHKSKTKWEHGMSLPVLGSICTFPNVKLIISLHIEKKKKKIIFNFLYFIFLDFPFRGSSSFLHTYPSNNNFFSFFNFFKSVSPGLIMLISLCSFTFYLLLARGKPKIY